MMLSSTTRLFVCMLILLTVFHRVCTAQGTGKSGAARTASSQPNITVDMVREDPRLERPITVRFRNASVAVFLADVSRQTGVDLRTSERDGTGDIPMTIVCEDTRLDRMLNGLWSCLSYRGALYMWERTGEPGHYAYRFSKSEGARRLPLRLKQRAQHRLERDAAILLEAANGTDEKKREALKKISDDPEKYARSEGLTDERMWHDLNSFNDALSPAQRQAVLHGQSVVAPLSSLSDKSQAYYNRIHQEYVAQQGGASGPRPQPPPFIRFSGLEYSSLPAVYIDVPNCTTFMPVIGGYNAYKEWKQYLSELWVLDGDSDADPNSLRKIDPMIANDTKENILRNKTGDPDTRDERTNTLFSLDSPPDPISTLCRQWEEVGVGSKVPLICRSVLDPEIEFFPSLPESANLTIGEFLPKLWNRKHLVKWRDSVLIATNVFWPNEDPPIPEAFVSKLRSDAKPGSIMPLADLTEAAESLTDRQLGRLASEFPVMREVRIWRGILLLMKRRPDLAQAANTEKQIPIDRELKAAIESVFNPRLLQDLAKTPPRSLSAVAMEKSDIGNASRRISILFHDNAGRVLGSFSFNERPIPLKKPVITPR